MNNLEEILDDVVINGFPELMDECILVKYKPMKKQWGIWDYYYEEGFYINIDSSLKDVHVDVIKGLFAHELAHISKDKELGKRLSSRIYSFYNGFNKKSNIFKIRVERENDARIIIRGYGHQLLALAKHHEETEGYSSKDCGLTTKEIETILSYKRYKNHKDMGDLGDISYIVIKNGFPDLLGLNILIEYKPLKNAFAEYGTLISGGFYIYIDSSLKKAPVEVKEGALAHELAHISKDKELRKTLSKKNYSFLKKSKIYGIFDERDTDLEIIIRRYGPQFLDLLEYYGEYYKKKDIYIKEGGLSINEVKAILSYQKNSKISSSSPAR